MVTFDGFFTGELDALETKLEAVYTTYNIFQGEKTLGEALSYGKPIISLTLGDVRPNPNEQYAWIFEIVMTYVKYDPDGSTYDALDDLEAVLDTVHDWYINTRNVSGNNVYGDLESVNPWVFPRDNNFVYGFRCVWKINKEEP